MTADAMAGRIPLEAVFGRRLEIIQPTENDVLAVGLRYVETAEPTAKATLTALATTGWTAIIVSGGYRQAIRPLAEALGIARIEAVDLQFDREGRYTGYDPAFPTTRSHGKPEIIRRLRAELRPARIVMVGDGMTDLETKPVVDLFVGFGRYSVQEKVKQGAAAFIMSLDALIGLLR